MKKVIKLFLSLFILLAMATPVYAIEKEFSLKEDGNTYYYNALEDGFNSSRSDIITPTYYIFAGHKSFDEATQLIKDFQMIDHVQQWAGKVTVINPLHDDYNAEDLTAFENMIKKEAVKNIKIIGVDSGATFVNNYISQRGNYVAGVLLINGEMKEGLTPSTAIPAYLSNTTDTAQKYYKEANHADIEKNEEKYTVYQNSKNNLQKTVIAKNEETKEEAFQNAWTSVFSQNFRYHNSQTEFYSVPALNSKQDILAMEYDLVQIPVFDELGVQYNQMVHQSVTGLSGSDYAWFEYIPKSTLNSEKGTVPLVVTLHGNNNDPRAQGDTSGWVELAAQEKFMVVSPEYQDNAFFTKDGHDQIYGKVDALGVDGIVNLIKDLQVKYPQIDASRIYVTGLSQGGATTSLLGIKYSNVFAAAGSISGVNSFAGQIDELMKDYQGNETPYLYMCGDHDFYQMIPVDGSSQHGTSELYGSSVWANDKNTHIFSALHAYQKVNGLTVSEMDMSKNPYFGIELENEHWTQLGNKDMLEGQLSNDKGVIMQLSAVKDLAHWNYKPEAQYVWNFFKNYKRNVETGELININNQTLTDQPSINDNTDDNSHNQAEKPNETNDKKNTSVKTGDMTTVLPWACLAVLSVGTMMYLKKQLK